MMDRAATRPRAVPDSSSCKPEWMRMAVPRSTAKRTMVVTMAVVVTMAAEVAEVAEAAEAEVAAAVEVVRVHLGRRRIVTRLRSPSRT